VRALSVVPMVTRLLAVAAGLADELLPDEAVC